MRYSYAYSTLLTRAGMLAMVAVQAIAAFATTYYVSPSGNDANNGTSQGAAWRTIDRVNQITYQIQPGDQILFQRGGQYRGEIIWGTSGTASAPIVIGAYGTGASPIIDGSELVTGWTLHSGNVWKAHVGQQVDQVYVSGTRMLLARTPNTGWFRNDQASGNSLHSDDLTQSNGFWTGARCVLRCTASSIDTLRVTGFNNGTLTFGSNPVNGNMGGDDWGFYLEKRLDLLDAPGEWFYESSSGMLYLQAPGNADPNSLQVEASVHWAGVICYPGRHHLTVDGLSFRHQRNAGVRVDDASQVTVTNCTFFQVYHGIRSYGHYDVFSNNTFSHTYATGCLMIDNNSLFENNTLEDIAMIPGEGESSWGYFGIRAIGPQNTIRGNRFDRIGYTAIETGSNQLVEKNVIKHHLATMNDGGGIAFDNTDGLTIQDNIIYDPICGLDGSSTVMPHYQRLGIGIYFGNTSNKNVTVQRNTIANLPGVGINVDHNMNAVGYQIKNNTIFNCDIGMSISDYSNNNGPHAVPPYYVPNYNDVYQGNIIYGLRKDQISLRFYNCYSAQPTDFGSFTNNRYFNPYNEMGIFLFSFQAGQHYFSLEEWQTERNEEAGTTRSAMRLSEFTTVAQLSNDLIPGGDFSTNVTGWGGWPTNAQVTHNTTHLDGGCLKAFLPDNSVYETFGLRNPDWFDLTAGDWYRLDLSTESNAAGQLRVAIKGLSQENNPYYLYDRLVPFSSERRDNSIYFQVPGSEPARLMLINRYTEPMYFLDNVELYKVQVAPVDPLEDQIVLINELAVPQTFALSGCWSDVDGAYYSESTTVPAFRSRVLVKEPGDPCAMSTAVEDEQVPAQVGGAYPNPVNAGGRLNFKAGMEGTALLIDPSGRVAARVALLAGSTGMDIPSTLMPGLYALRITGGPVDYGQQVVVQ